MDKKLKDPIYGYIDIPIEFVNGIVDTAIFQRLRRIIQTSYAPLYSSAIHNRFVHSIGVFYLGRIAAEQLREEIIRKKFLVKAKTEKYVRIYEMACLLHDDGHAPFSHTGEGFYKTDNYRSTELHNILVEAVGNEKFRKDIPTEESEAAAPHEIMSCIIGIREFGELLGDVSSKEFFARCITGYLYKKHTKENDIKNCLISMLNSKVIDVDRLDYLIRDAYIIGFESVSIDYIRLLSSLTIVSDDNEYRIAYRKNALSIIENVIYAHDAEKKWIQNHPVVLYEGFIIQSVVGYLNEVLNDGDKKLFSVEALSKKGITFKNGLHISLMCDDDIVYLLKNVYPEGIGEEFFERRKRRHPVWKSEAEYNAYISAMSKGGQIKEEFMDCLKSFVGGKPEGLQKPLIINDELMKVLEKEWEQKSKEAEKALENATDFATIESIKQQQKGVLRKLSLCKYLNKYAETHGLQKDFVIIKANAFKSNFSKDEIAKVLIVFDQGKDEIIKQFSDVCKTLKADDVKEEFYYLYYRSGKNHEIISKREFCHNLYYAALGLTSNDLREQR